MIIRLHNKTIVALKQAVAAAKSKGGLVSRIDFAPKEGVALIKELHANHDESFTIRTIGKTVDFELKRILEGDSKELLDTSKVKKLVEKWHQREYYIQYSGPDGEVPIFIVDPKKPKAPEPKMLENETFSEYEVK